MRGAHSLPRPASVAGGWWLVTGARSAAVMLQQSNGMVFSAVLALQLFLPESRSEVAANSAQKNVMADIHFILNLVCLLK